MKNNNLSGEKNSKRTSNNQPKKWNDKRNLRQSQVAFPKVTSPDIQNRYQPELNTSSESVDSLDNSSSSITSNETSPRHSILANSNNSLNSSQNRKKSLSFSSSTLQSSSSSINQTPVKPPSKLETPPSRGKWSVSKDQSEDDSDDDNQDDLVEVSQEFSDSEEDSDDFEIETVNNDRDRDRVIHQLLSKLQNADQKIKDLKGQVAYMVKETHKSLKNSNNNKPSKKGWNNSLSNKSKGKKLKKGGKARSMDGFEEGGNLKQVIKSFSREGMSLSDGSLIDSKSDNRSELAGKVSVDSDFDGNRFPIKSPRLGHIRASSDELFLQMFNKTLHSDINIADERGNLPIHNFIIDGNKKAVQELLERGADIESPDSSGNTPLLLALHNNQYNIAQLLVDYNANVNNSDSNNNSPLVLACTHNYFDIAERLIQIGADVNVISSSGNSPLMLACHHRYTYDLVSLMIGRGADINSKNRYGETSLMNACSLGFTELVMLMLEGNADVNIKDRHGNSALHKASLNGHREIVEILVEQSAELRIRNDQGHTPLDLAATPQIRKILEDYDPGVKSWKWEIDYTKLKIEDKPIGEGKFSICYRGSLHGTPVAVKVLKVKTLNESVIQSFNHEVGIMADIKHPNVVLFLGASNYDPHLCIITEFLPYGSLRNYIEFNTVRWNQLLKFAITTARGMAWLHSRAPVVLHRDLHSNNILVTENLECKVADLGLSQIQGQRNYSASMYKRIIPPEILKGEMFTKKSDVFSYGLILYELSTTKKADTTTIKQISSLSNFDEKNEPGKQTYIDLIKACTSNSPEERPHFEEILSILELLSEKNAQYQREIRLQEPTSSSVGEYV